MTEKKDFARSKTHLQIRPFILYAGSDSCNEYLKKLTLGLLTDDIYCRPYPKYTIFPANSKCIANLVHRFTVRVYLTTRN